MGIVAMVHSFEHFQISQSKLGFMHLGSYQGCQDSILVQSKLMRVMEPNITTSIELYMLKECFILDYRYIGHDSNYKFHSNLTRLMLKFLACILIVINVLCGQMNYHCKSWWKFYVYWTWPWIDVLHIKLLFLKFYLWLYPILIVQFLDQI
jgi:hypothetical protein